MRASPTRRLLALACLTCLSILLARAIRPVAALTLAPADTTTGLVGRWPLNDGANPTADIRMAYDAIPGPRAASPPHRCSNSPTQCLQAAPQWPGHTP